MKPCLRAHIENREGKVFSDFHAFCHKAIFCTLIIGGLGSVEGCFIGALTVGLVQNYAAFLEPKLALISNIALMVAILMWRPMGMVPVVKAK